MEDIIEAVHCVQDEKVMEILSARLYTRLAPFMEIQFAKFASEFKTEFKSELKSLVDKSAADSVAEATEILIHKVSVLEQENKSLKLRIDDLENYSRLDNLIIHGLPEPAAAEQSDQQLTSLQSDQLTRKEILSVCHDRIGLVDILETDISTAYRIRLSGKDVHRPVIFRFTSRVGQRQ